MSGFKVNFSVNNQLATPSIHAAALANRPAAGQPGRVFIDTDNPSTGIYRDTGAIWVQIAETSDPEADTLQTVTDRGNTTTQDIAIGTSSTPSAPLDVHGADTIAILQGTGTNNAFLQFNKSGNGKFKTGNVHNGGNDYFTVYNMQENADAILVNISSNNVAIGGGVVAPTYRLDVQGSLRSTGNTYLATSGGNGVAIGSTSITSNYELDLTGDFRLTGQQYFYTSLNNGVILAANGNNYGTITFGSAGYGGAGFSIAPYYGGSRGWVTGGASYEFTYNTNLGVFNKDFLQYNSLGTVQFYIKNSNGNVIIGNGTTDAGYRLDVQGTLRSNTMSIIRTDGAATLQLAQYNTSNFLLLGTTGSTINAVILGNNRWGNSISAGASYIQNDFTQKKFVNSGLSNSTTNAFELIQSMAATIGSAYTHKLQYFEGNINNTGTTTTYGGHFVVNDNSASIANTIYGFYVDVSGGTNTSATKYSAIFLGGSVSVGTNTPSASAIIQADSTTKGFLPPRMTGAQAEAIGTPAAGLLVYANNGNGVTITTTGWWGYDGATWVKLN